MTKPTRDVSAASADSPTTDVQPSASPKIAPTLQLSRRGLVLSLSAMAALGLSVYALFPESINGPSLPVSVTLDRDVVATKTGEGATLTDVVVIKNLADVAIPRLSIEVNGQYLLHRESPLPADEPLILPLRVFTDKRSSQRYNPVKYPPIEVMVTGQLPSGARGISHFDFD
ncbi:hypothetical protein [Stieleria marina]|uniref:Uncharacterized protein n=1 Tax=Stieleria marina TaxID=1930275 RepID=A0A517NXM0_9BACT|nr:hypothetical protein K239x_38760 [Planctomycetes bacterium K23_9]